MKSWIHFVILVLFAVPAFAKADPILLNERTLKSAQFVETPVPDSTWVRMAIDLTYLVNGVQEKATYSYPDELSKRQSIAMKDWYTTLISDIKFGTLKIEFIEGSKICYKKIGYFDPSANTFTGSTVAVRCP